LGTITSAVKQHYNDFEFAKVYKVLYSFCNEDLSSFYLDILKDRLYTSHTSSQERRSAQTVLFQILNHVVRFMAPIMVFTADEVFAAMPKTLAMQGVDNVHCLEWLDVPAEWQNAQIDKKFELLIALRPHVLRALEDARTKGEIGSSLEAKICFQTASQRDLQYLEDFGNMLPAIFIVSQVAVEQIQGLEKGLSETFSQTIVQISKAAGEKCSRCWNYFSDLGSDPVHPSLCRRCTGVVKKLENEGVVHFS
jgi:isoleucyl-tRNA synthetase